MSHIPCNPNHQTPPLFSKEPDSLHDQSPTIESRLVDRIRSGDQDGWSDLISTFQKRLLLFARQQVDSHDLAEDLVQETFISFLNTVRDYRRECSLETFLFQILRRRIIDFHRVKGRRIDARVCVIEDGSPQNNQRIQRANEAEQDPAIHLECLDQVAEIQSRLSAAIRHLTDGLCTHEKFRDLQIAESTIFAGFSNRVVGEMLQCAPKKIAVIKHRLIARLAREVAAQQTEQLNSPFEADFVGLLTGAWEAERPSCPKRTTLGKFVLGLLSEPWMQHIQFHAIQLGCRFCKANLEELAGSIQHSKPNSAQRIFQSTVGFMKAKGAQQQ